MTVDQLLLIGIIVLLIVMTYGLEKIYKEIHALRLDRLP
jgi:hypothetical protein